MHTSYVKALFLCAYYYFPFQKSIFNTCRGIPCIFAQINVFTRLNTANIDVGTLPECIPCIISATYSYINMCWCIRFVPKLRSCVITTTFYFRNRCTLVEHISYMFGEMNVFTSLNTANINVRTLSECIPCMISAA